MQIFASLCVTYEDVPWPKALKGFSISMGAVVNLDLMSVFGWTACAYNLPFIQKFLLHMFLPPAILLVLVIARFPAHFLCKKHRLRHKELLYKIGISVLLVMYPGLCTRIFQLLKCKQISGVGDSLLQADFSVVCGGSLEGRPMNVVMIFLGLCESPCFLIGSISCCTF
jgi:hypothetical protein